MVTEKKVKNYLFCGQFCIPSLIKGFKRKFMALEEKHSRLAEYCNLL